MRMGCRLTTAPINARIDNPTVERIGKINDVREHKSVAALSLSVPKGSLRPRARRACFLKVRTQEIRLADQ